MHAHAVILHATMSLNLHYTPSYIFCKYVVYIFFIIIKNTFSSQID